MWPWTFIETTYTGCVNSWACVWVTILTIVDIGVVVHPKTLGERGFKKQQCIHTYKFTILVTGIQSSVLLGDRGLWMPSLCDPEDFSEIDQYIKHNPYQLDKVFNCYLYKRRSLRLFETQKYHKLKVYSKRSMSLDRKMYPDWHNGLWEYPPCRSCDCQLIPLMSKDKTQKSFVVDSSSRVTDHPVFKKQKLGCGPNEKLTWIVTCEGFLNCRKRGVGKYWCFRPCGNCRDLALVSYRLSGSQTGQEGCVHVCDHCMSRIKYPSSSTFIGGHVVRPSGWNFYFGKSKSSSSGCVFF